MMHTARRSARVMRWILIVLAGLLAAMGLIVLAAVGSTVIVYLLSLHGQ
jgi:hypothetical protein